MNKKTQSSGSGTPGQAEQDHRSRQLNSNNEEFWKSRGYEKRPEDWETAEPEPKHPPKQNE